MIVKSDKNVYYFILNQTLKLSVIVILIVTCYWLWKYEYISILNMFLKNQTEINRPNDTYIIRNYF